MGVPIFNCVFLRHCCLDLGHKLKTLLSHYRNLLNDWSHTVTWPSLACNSRFTWPACNLTILYLLLMIYAVQWWQSHQPTWWVGFGMGVVGGRCFSVVFQRMVYVSVFIVSACNSLYSTCVISVSAWNPTVYWAPGECNVMSRRPPRWCLIVWPSGILQRWTTRVCHQGEFGTCTMENPRLSHFAWILCFNQLIFGGKWNTPFDDYELNEIKYVI